ncbi:YncE family protein, partial [Methylobacterium ajmalii]
MRRARLLAVLAFAHLACAHGALAGEIYVAGQEAGVVSRVDPATNRVVATIPVGPGPAGLATGPGGRVYVTHPDHRAITVIDGPAGRVVARLDHPGSPFGIAAAPDGSALYVGDWRRG